MRVNDFFCGAGGMGMGFKNAGFRIVGAWDWLEHAVESYAQNVGKHVKQQDIKLLTGDEVPEAEVWTFGFPCQDLSRAGKMAGMIKGVTRSGMFFEIMRLLGEVERKPEVIVAENVRDLKKVLPILEEEYKKAGYKVYVKLFNSKFWNVPQNRERYFCVGIREDFNQEFVFPEQGTEITTKLISILEDDVDEKLFKISENAMSLLSIHPEGLRVKQATKLGYDVAKIGDAINVAHPKSKTRRGRRGKQIAQTILTSPEQIVWLPDGRLRYLSSREAARCQGFPDSYEQVVSDKDFYFQMGNAVTINVAEVVANSIKEFLVSNS